MNTAQKVQGFARAMVNRKLEFKFDGMPFRIENVSNKKLSNLMRSTWNCSLPRPKPPQYPIQLQIEPSSACMLKCPLCPAADAKSIPSRLLPLDKFRSIMDEVGDYATIAVLWMWGEPLMNPHFADMVAYAKKKNLATVTSTNGHAIQSTEDAEKIVASGLDVLVVALDGVDQETYSSYRVGGDIQKVLRSLELVRQAKESLGSIKPLVNVRTVVSRQNESQLEEIEEIARQYGADMVARKSMAVCDLSGPESGESFAPSNPKYVRGALQNGNVVRKSVEGLNCRRPWTRMTVNASGTVIPCEFDFHEANAFGKEGSALDAWRSDKAESFRRGFLERKSDYSFCRNCTYKDGRSFQCTVEAKRLKG